MRQVPMQGLGVNTSITPFDFEAVSVRKTVNMLLLATEYIVGKQTRERSLPLPSLDSHGGETG